MAFREITEDELEELRRQKSSGISPKNAENPQESAKDPTFQESFDDFMRLIPNLPYQTAKGLFHAPSQLREWGNDLGDLLMDQIIPDRSYIDRFREAQAEDNSYIAQAEDYLNQVQATAEERIAPQTELGRVASKGAQDAGEFAGWGALLGVGSPGKELMTGGLFGAGSQTAKEKGAGPWGQFFSGLGLSLVPSVPGLLGKGIESVGKVIQFGKEILSPTKISEGTPKFLTETSPRSLADLKLHQNSDAAKKRIATLSNESIENLEESLNKYAEADLPSSFEGKEIEQKVIEGTKNAYLDAVSPSSGTKADDWKAVQNAVRDNFDVAKETYDAAFENLYEQGSKIKASTENLAKESKSLGRDINKSLVEIAEENPLKRTARKTTENLKNPLLNDIDQSLAEMSQYRESLLKQGTLEAEELLETVEELMSEMTNLRTAIPSRQVPLDRLFATVRSINRTLSKKDIIPAPIKLLNRLKEGAQKDIEVALENYPELGKFYTNLQESYKDFKKVFDSEPIMNLRRQGNDAAKFGKEFEKSSNINLLNAAIAENRPIKDLADRLIVDQLGSKSLETSRELGNEARRYLSKNANEALELIQDMQSPLTEAGQKMAKRSEILKDVTSAANTGSTPSYTMDMMKTPKGYQLVKDVLDKSPKGKRAFKALERTIVRDAFNNILDEQGVIDFTKASRILENPQIEKIIKDSLGNEGLQFFKNLETYGKNYIENTSRFLDYKDPKYVRFAEKYMGKNIQGMLISFGLGSFYGLPTGALSLLASMAGKSAANKLYQRNLVKLITSPEGIKSVKDVSKKGVTTAVYMQGIRKIDELMNEGEE